jgi:hypothetical protein
VHLWQYPLQFLKWKLFQTEVVEKLKNTKFMFSNLFPKIVSFMR